jgi:hypothetical protein
MLAVKLGSTYVGQYCSNKEQTTNAVKDGIKGPRRLPAKDKESSPPAARRAIRFPAFGFLFSLFLKDEDDDD